MECNAVRQNLSAYFDNELAAAPRATIAEHLQTCADCTAALARIRSLSTLARELPDPVPSDLWPGIEYELAPQWSAKSVFQRSAGRWKAMHVRWRMPIAAVAIAASLLIGFFAWPLVHPHNAHDEMAINLSHYIEQFATDPGAAERTLRLQYNGRSIEAGDVIKLVNYKPLAPAQLNDGVVRSQMYLFEMPCCKCVQSLYRRPDGGVFAVFEHVDEQPAWFGKRPAIHANCSHKDVCLVECNGQLAASLQLGERFVTLVGVKNLEEVNQIVATFSSAGSADQDAG